MSISPVSTGGSTYATDFQSVIDRSLAIASLPLKQMQNQVETMNAQSTAMDSLRDRFSALIDAVETINDAIGPSSFSAVSSNPSALTATAGAGALQGTYTLNIANLGSYSSSISNTALPAVANPYDSSISSATEFTLTINGTAHQITPGGSSLMDLAQAINDASAGAKAIIINTGSSSAPQYRLVVRSTSLGAGAVQLSDGSQDLLTTLNVGEEASYTIDGLATPIYSTSRTVTLAPGIRAELLQTTPDQPVTLTVGRSVGSIGDALSAFADAYNAAVDELDKHHGETAGILAGQSVLRDVQSGLRSLTQFTNSSGTIRSLHHIGLDLDRFGHVTFDASALTADNIDAVNAFLGATSTGGFLKAAADALDRVGDETSGAIAVAAERLQASISRQKDRIETEQERISTLADRMQLQMAAADALIASLQSQRNYMTNLFTAMMNGGKDSGVKSY